jgi:molecular chaperone DnaK
VKLELTREKFEKQTRHLVEKCKTICEMVMQEAKMKWDKIDKVLLVGGMTRMPMVRAMISGLTPSPVIDNVNPDEAVALGAAIQAILSMLREENVTGEKVLGDDTRQQFSSRDGGLIQVTDITSHTLGVVLWDEKQLQEYVFPMIRKMTAIPALAKNSFGTASANMQHAVVKIVEGESSLPAECTPIGVCDVKLPPFLPKGSPVELTYEYNANQVLEVAVEACGNRSKVSIGRNTGLAPEEIGAAMSGLSDLTVA